MKLEWQKKLPHISYLNILTRMRSGSDANKGESCIWEYIPTPGSAHTCWLVEQCKNNVHLSIDDGESSENKCYIHTYIDT